MSRSTQTIAAVTIYLTAAIARAECPKGYVVLPAPEYHGGPVERLSWTPPPGTPADASYEILSSEHTSTSDDHCKFAEGAEEHVVATTSDTFFDYHMPQSEVFRVGVQVAGCADTHSLSWFTDTFNPPQVPAVHNVTAPSGSGTVTFSFSEGDVHTYEVALGRVDPAGEAPLAVFPAEVFPNVTGFGDGSTANVGFCPAGSNVVVSDGKTPGTPERLSPGAYLYWLVAINFGFGHSSDHEVATDPICVNIDCPACNCQSTLTPVDANCTDEQDIECGRGIPDDLSKLFKSPRRSYLATDGVSEIVLFQALSTDDEVTFSMKTLQGPINGSAYGALLALEGGASTSIRVRPQLVIGNLHYAFVRYRAPADLPSGDPSFYVEATIPSRKDLPGHQWLYHPVSSVIISLVAPPVVLVHGVWSDPSVWTGLRNYLVNSGHPVCTDCIVNYGDTASDDPNNAPSFDPTSIESSTVMDALDQTVDAARASYRLSGIAVSQVDAVGHSMGGLVLRARTVYPFRGYARASNGLHGDFHKLITIGSPHAGSPLADWLIRHKCDQLHIAGSPTIEEKLAKMGKPLGPAIYQFQTGSMTLRHLGVAAVPSFAVVGITPNAITELEDELDEIPLLSGNAGISVESIMSAAGVHQHDVIVPADSQAGGLANATEVHNVVHTRVNVGSRDIPETESPSVWSQVGDALKASVTSPIFGTFEIPSDPETAALDSVPCPGPIVPPPADDAGTLSVTPGTVVHPGDAVSVSFAPSSNFDGCMMTFGSSTFVRHGACAVTWTVPTSRGGRVDVSAATFGSNKNSHAASYFVVREPVAPSAIRITPGSLTLHTIGETAQLRVAASFGGADPLDVTSSTAETTYSTPHGNSIVSISITGKITAMGAGREFITASHRGLTTTILVTVAVTNHPPTLAPVSPEYRVPAGTTALVELNATDADSNKIIFSALRLPHFATLSDRGNGSAFVQIQPSAADIGAYEGTVAVTDNGLPPLGAAISFKISVVDGAAPVRGKRRAVRH
ncbi:MAG TPA: alpha/beta fold hydrolase [Thermoanaerobaculia bacterium]|nr:alpha/beta fold hydrolase [Thermoanaerobaculia bacterium]